MIQKQTTMVNACKFQNNLTVAMDKQWTLPIKNQPAQIIETQCSKKRKVQKHTDTKTLENQIQKCQMEIAMLKLHQKELIRNLLNVEIERDRLKTELEAMQVNRADAKVASLISFCNTLLTGTNTHASKLAQKRSKASVIQRCPDAMLNELRGFFNSSPDLAVAGWPPEKWMCALK